MFGGGIAGGKNTSITITAVLIQESELGKEAHQFAIRGAAVKLWSCPLPTLKRAGLKGREGAIRTLPESVCEDRYYEGEIKQETQGGLASEKTAF